MLGKIASRLRVVIIVASVVAVFGPIATGVGLGLISLIFCDTGDLPQCVRIGATFLGVLLLIAAIPVPALLALASGRRRFNWYLYGYPFVLLGVSYLTYRFELFPVPGPRVSIEYAVLSLVCSVYLSVRLIDEKR